MVKFQPAGVLAMVRVGRKSPKRLKSKGRLGDGAREHIFDMGSISLAGNWRDTGIDTSIQTDEALFIRDVSLSLRYRTPRKSREIGIISENYNDTAIPSPSRIPGTVTQGIPRKGFWYMWLSESPKSEGLLLSQSAPITYPVSFAVNPGARTLTISWTVNTPLEAGKTLILPRVSINRGDRERIFRSWRLEWANASSRTLSVDRRIGWCDEGDILSPKDLREQLVAIRTRKLPVDWLALGPNYALSSGDWLTPSETFRDRMGSLSRSIGEANLSAGLRFAPFLVSRSSKIATDHRDWLVKNPNGNPLARPGYPMSTDTGYVLDVTNSDVIQHIKRMFSVMRDQWGYRVFILERLEDINILGNRSNPDTSPGELAEIAARTIRESVGNKVMLVASGFPLLCSPGLWDARISVPVVRKRKNLSRIYRKRSSAAVAAILHRSAWREPVWINAVGPVPHSQIGPNCGSASATFLSAVTLATGMLLLCGDPRNIEDSNQGRIINLLTQFAECRRGRLSVVPSVGGGSKSPLITRNDRGWIGLFNLTGRRREVRLERDALKDLLGVSGPLSAGDGAVFNSPEIHVALPARGHRLFRA